MRRAALLGGVLTSVLALVFLNLSTGFAGDAGLIAMIACVGVYVGCTMPLEDR
jgi:hypothetical protein